MWFHTNFFIPPKAFMYNGDLPLTKTVSFGFSTEEKKA